MTASLLKRKFLTKSILAENGVTRFSLRDIIMKGPKHIPEVARTGSILTSINFNFYNEEKMSAGSNGLI